MKTIALFDIDGTLTTPRGKITPDMLSCLKSLKNKMSIGVVGGSDFEKQKEQLGDDVLSWVNYSFSENGVVAYKDNQLLAELSIINVIGNDVIKKLINFCLHYIADLDIPVKRGTFVEFRRGMINISPIGRNCSQKEREEFEHYDAKHNVRSTMVDKLKEKFGDQFAFAIGGQISIDVYPHGWDKTFCLRYLNDFDTIYFFGDKTEPGGNDYEIFSHPRVIGYHVDTFLDTIKLINQLF